MMTERIPAKSIIGKTGLDFDFAANPYLGCQHACKYCYAVFMKRFAKHPGAWGEYVGVKTWDGDKIRRSWRYYNKSIVIGTVTDGYQPAEAKYERTRALLKQMAGTYGHESIRLFITTKSYLVTRDIDLISQFPKARVAISLNSIDQHFLDNVDQAPPAEDRLRAIKELHRSGIYTICFIAPAFPKLSRIKSTILAVKDYADEIWIEKLVVFPHFKAKLFTLIADKYPDLYDLYHNTYVNHDDVYWREVRCHLDKMEIRYNLKPIKVF